MTGVEGLRQELRSISRRELGRREAGVRLSFEAQLKKARDLGLFDPGLFEEGGAWLAPALNELAQVTPDLALAVLAHWAARGLALAGGVTLDPDQLLGFQVFEALDESSGGPCAIAQGESEHFALTGFARSVVLPESSQHAVVAALVPGELRASYYWVDLKQAGVVRGAPVRTLGLRECPLVDLKLSAVPARRLGRRVTAELLHAAAGIVLGVAESSVDEAIRYARVRVQGGRDIGQWSEIKMLLARMDSRLRLAKLAFEASLTDERDAHALLLGAQELACRLVSDGIQVLGGAGYTMEFRQEERFRAAFELQHLFGNFLVRRLRYSSLLSGLTGPEVMN